MSACKVGSRAQAVVAVEAGHCSACGAAGECRKSEPWDRMERVVVMIVVGVELLSAAAVVGVCKWACRAAALAGG